MGGNWRTRGWRAAAGEFEQDVRGAFGLPVLCESSTQAVAVTAEELVFPALLEIVMTTDTATLKDLVEVLNDGKNFYETAASGVELPQFKQIFSQMARTKAAMANDFKAMIVIS